MRATKPSLRAIPTPSPALPHRPDRLPLFRLLTLAMVAFITILTEALPAALLPQIAKSLQISEALTGQTVSLYAIGSLLAAIPLTTRTQGVRRRPLLLTALLGFVLANGVMTLSSHYPLTLVARFVAGMSAGLVWALLAGYAARMAPIDKQGKAIAIAMVGTPLALSLGVPLGAFLAAIVGWRACFGAITVLTAMLMVCIHLYIPDFPGGTADARPSLRAVALLPGVRAVLFQVTVFVLAHNILYTYIGPYLAHAGLAAHTDAILLMFGVAAVVAIVLTGMFIERWLHRLIVTGIVLFGGAVVLLGFSEARPLLLCLGIGLWGLAFGGAASLFQTALAKRAGNATDVAQSMLVTAWNLAIAGGGIAGGLLLKRFGVGAFAPVVGVLLLAAGWSTWRDRRGSSLHRS